MNKCSIIFLGILVTICYGREPIKPFHGAVPYMVYYTSRYRGICVGTLVHQTVVLTAAVCVCNPRSLIPDTQPINVVTGTSYRHPRRGVRVQITKILKPKMPTDLSRRAHELQISPALLLMKRKIPDVLTEVPLRALDIDWMSEESLNLQEECMMIGWHFFYKNDKIFPVSKFLLQRNIRVQFLNVVRMHAWCDVLSIKLEKSLANLGYEGELDKSNMICVRDPDQAAQPCHGSYGSPLVCRGRVVGVMVSPDGQWTNCTGQSNIIHRFNTSPISNFMKCVSGMFSSEMRSNGEEMKKALYDEMDEYDYLPALYGRVVAVDGESSSDEI
ncbi:granzyme M-like [Hyposmocoma kahamanoa]|uniref:granzyme M-like n=1 Tax=Hyposmocoma kahamanoa TaxID=1477025 RepID=UPI000E6D7500|nr:granzyme M-like [Hyposmocoma kahamanoa]